MSVPSRGGVGYYTIDFGFQVDNRFLSITPASPGIGTVVAQVATGATSNEWEVEMAYSPHKTNFSDDQAVSADAAFFILIY